jgi:IgGFc binding protein
VDIACTARASRARKAQTRAAWTILALAALTASWLFAACSGANQASTAASAGSQGPSSSGAGGAGGMMIDVGDGSCDPNPTCSNDLKSVVDCKGKVLSTCTADQGCANGQCIADPCQAAEVSKSSYGCDYWALKTALRPQADGACFAAFVANTWGKPVHIQVDRGGQKLPDGFAYIPESVGQTIKYVPYDPAAGLAVGQVAVLFLSRNPFGGSVVDCPVPAAVSEDTGVVGTGRGKAFHISTDYPVVAYQIVPYGGAQAYVTSATLLLPTSAWDTNYIAINAYGSAEPNYPGGNPSLAILAHQDNTTVSILPGVDILGGPGVDPAKAGMTGKYTLNQGEFLQITQPAELTGSPIQSDKPVGVWGAHTCMAVPAGQIDCDSGQQQIAPVRALGSEYVAVRYKNRIDGKDEAPPWRLVGAVDDTQLSWEPSAPPGAPKTLSLGQVVELSAPGPFVVRSQDADHPFYLGGYMTGGQPFGGAGDPDWINVIPPAQYLSSYVLFTDPTYPETSLVVTRAPSKEDGSFADVTLACRGKLGGWTKIGNYEYTRVDLVTGDFQGVSGCANGRQEMSSALPFGVEVWGWGTTQQTKLVSYAYPAGAGFQPINQVVVPAVPK